MLASCLLCPTDRATHCNQIWCILYLNQLTSLSLSYTKADKQACLLDAETTKGGGEKRIAPSHNVYVGVLADVGLHCDKRRICN